MRRECIALMCGCFAAILFSGCRGQMPSDGDAALEVIMTRTSIRAYQDRAVEPEKIEKMLRAAMAAPTARNSQPWAFVSITDRKVLQALADASPHGKMVGKAPLAIVVCGDLNRALPGDGQAFWVQDASAATENLLLAAHAQGLGAVWTGGYPVKERVEAIRKVLNMPENLVPLCLIPIGYPAENPQPKNKWDPSKIQQNRW